MTNNPYNASPLHLAAANGDVAEVQRLLRNAGSFAGLRTGDDLGMTPLHYACFTGETQVIECFLYLEASLACRRANNGLLPLHVATKSQHTDSVALLLRDDQTHLEARSALGWTALHFATYNNDLNTIMALADVGANVNATSANGSSPLHIAAARDHVETLRCIHSNLFRDTINTNIADFESRTPLISATINASVRAVDALTIHGCQIDDVDKNGWTALHWAASTDNIDIARQLIKKRSDLDKFSKDGETPLHVATLFQNCAMMALLIESGADVNAIADTEDARRSIHSAAFLGNIEAMDLLFKLGAEKNSRCNAGRTPLFYSLVAGHTDAMKWLYNRKESLLAVDSQGNNLFHALDLKTKRSVEAFECLSKLYSVPALAKHLLSLRNSDGYTPLCRAAVTDNVRLAARILEINPEIVNLSNEAGISPLHGACGQRNAEMVELLLKAGANVNSLGPDNSTPLHLCSILGYTDIMTILLAWNASKEPRTTSLCLTPAHFAAQNGQAEALELLAQHGADLNALMLQGASCLHLAASNGSYASTIVLLQKGLDPRLRTKAQGDVLSMAISGGDVHVVEAIIEAVNRDLGRKLGTGLEQDSDVSEGLTQSLNVTSLQMGSFCHLPRIWSSIDSSLEVPCLADHLYDGPSLKFYLAKRGWCLQPNPNSEVQFCSPAQDLLEPRIKFSKSLPLTKSLGFLQGWFFFGVIVEWFKACEVKVNVDDFVTTGRDGKSKIITTIALPRYLDSLINAEQKLSVAVQRKHISKVYASLTTSWYYYSRLGLGGTAGSSTVRSSHHDQKEYILLSIALVCEALNNAVAQIWPAALRLEFEPTTSSNRAALQRKTLMVPGGPLKELWPPLTIYTLQSGYILDRMRSRGWCPNQISMLTNSTLGVTAVYLISMLERPVTPSHLSCTEAQCCAFNIEESTYKVRHIEGCTGCEDVSVDCDEITQVLKNGRIPAVRIHEDALNKAVTLQVVEAEYIAISHVWADGRGNPKSNALTKCQLSKIKQMINEIVQKEGENLTASAVWIDTLCVPLQTEPRRLALGLLGKTYRQADRVLVLDAELESTSCNVSLEEVFARLICSAWIRRLWTLQEAMVAENRALFQFREDYFDKTLSRDKAMTKIYLEEMRVTENRLLVQFRDGYVDVTAKKTEAMKRIFLQPHCSHRGLWDLVNVFFSKIASQTKDKHISGLNDLGEAVTYRSTSKASDEHICLASLLGLDVYKLALIPRNEIEKRVICFYRLLDKKNGIPVNILFSAGPRLQVDGFRWAISSFLANSTRAANSVLNIKPPPSAIKCEIHRSGFGLNVTIGGWLISDLDIPLDGDFAFKDARTGIAFHCSNQDRIDKLWSGKQSWQDRQLNQTAVLFTPWFVGLAALVAIIENKDDVITARFLWRINMTEMGQFDNLLSTMKALEAQGKDTEEHSRDLPRLLRSVEGLADGQKWRIF